MKNIIYGIIFISAFTANCANAAFLSQNDNIEYRFNSTDFSFLGASTSPAFISLQISFAASPPVFVYDPITDTFINQTPVYDEVEKFFDNEFVEISLFENIDSPTAAITQQLNGTSVGGVIHIVTPNTFTITPSGVLTNSLWSDFEGLVNINMVSGNALITSIDLYINDGVSEYSASLNASPVPLPSSLILLISGIFSLCVGMRRKNV